MKRSGDVTVAVILLFGGCALLLLLGAVTGLAMFAALPGAPSAGRAALLMPVFMYLALAAWGIATGIGVLKLQPWARISIVVMSALAVVGCVLAGAGIAFVSPFLKNNPQIPPNFLPILIVTWGVILLIPLGISIWWLILFTRKRVALEFASRGASTQGPASFAPAPEQGTVPSQNFASASAPPQSAAPPAPPAFPAAPNAPLHPQIPISIRIIAVLFLVFGVLPLLSFPLVARRNIPTLLLGFVIHGWAAKSVLLATAFVEIGFCAAVLWKRVWALDALIAFFIFYIANAVAFFFSPSRSAALSQMFAQQPMPSAMDPASFQLFQRMMTAFFPFIMLASVALYLLVLYFLFTRRRAFRAACASPAR